MSADSKLATISTAGKVSLSALDIDGGSDIGADLTHIRLDCCYMMEQEAQIERLL